MSSSNSLAKAACLLLIATPLPLAGCDRDIMFAKGEPDTAALDAFMPQDTAETLCRYTRGPFPNWSLWKEFEAYLRPEERDAVEYVSRRLIQNVPVHSRPRYLAVSAFIAEHTACSLKTEDGAAAIQKDSTGAAAVSFRQTSPKVPNIPEIGGRNLSEQELLLKNLAALNEAYDGATNERDVTVVVEPGRDGRYRLRSSVKKSYEEPLMAQEFLIALERHRYPQALETLALACVRNEATCSRLRPLWESAMRWKSSAQAQFARDVEIADIRATHVALTATASMTSVRMRLTNRGDVHFSDIVFATDENEPQHCVLQADDSKRENSPLTLRAKETADAWCRLAGDTKPRAMPAFWTSAMEK